MPVVSAMGNVRRGERGWRMQTDLFITTPCLNAVQTIDQTIQSVVSQAGPVRIRYHIQDGGSSDGTWERVLWWQERVSSGEWPLACAELQFSCHRVSDAGLYDAIVAGFAALAPSEQGFLAWINADDIYLPGTFAFVAAADRQFPRDAIAWIGGGVSVLRDDMVVASHDRELPTSVIRAGLCDHAHWHFVQQEGSFFRGWLWDRVNPEQTIRPMKLAGDWNLWRLMAGHAELVQAGRPLASFRVRPDQLSVTQAKAYQAEIEAILPETARRQAFREIASGAPLMRLRLESRFAADALTLVEEAVDGRDYSRFPKAFAAAAFKPMRRVRMKGRADLPVPVDTAERQPSAAARSRQRHLRRGEWFQALDTSWQYPAITEEHAFRRLEAMGGLPDGMVYVAYPWATLIDNLQAEGADKETQVEVFEAFCARLPEGGPKVTVCQHILLPHYLHLFRKAGIDHVFWAHTTKADLAAEAPRLHPFPLYPVQRPDPALAEAGSARPHLYSFIGARADPHYLTEVRHWILDTLGDRPEALIRGREHWHYHRVVYRHQIGRAGIGATDGLLDDVAAREFSEALSRSVFALCPSGSGPNSIRLWEALEAGAIPVILSDHLALPGDPRLWAAGAVFCAETPEAVAALPGRLAALAGDAERIDRMRRAGQQIRDLYGPAAFVTDILALGRQYRDTEARQGPPPDVRRLARRLLAARRPDRHEAELVLALAAGDAAIPESHDVVTTVPVAAAQTRARARLGARHPALHLVDSTAPKVPPEVERRAETDPDPALQSLFPGPLAALAQRMCNARRPDGIDGDPARLRQRRDAAIAASDIPEDALLCDQHAALYRLFLHRDADLSVVRCLARWQQGRIVEGREDPADGDWPDPRLARFSRLHGACRVLWTTTRPAATAVEAVVLGAIPACPAAPGLDRVVPADIRIDLSGLSGERVQRAVAAVEPGPAFAADWLAARATLRARLSDPDRIESARRAVIEAVLWAE